MKSQSKTRLFGFPLFPGNCFVDYGRPQRGITAIQPFGPGLDVPENDTSFAEIRDAASGGEWTRCDSSGCDTWHGDGFFAQFGVEQFAGKFGL